MAFRDRLERLASIGAHLASSRRVRVGSQILLLAGLVFVALRLKSIWRDSHFDLSHIDPLALAGATALTAAGIVGGGLIWLIILKNLNVQPHLRWLKVFFQAQIAKYIPGSIWQYAGRTALAQEQGIPARSVAFSIGVEFAASMIAGAAVASLLLGPIGFAVVAGIGLAAVVARRKVGLVRRADLRGAADALPTAVVLYAAVWLVLGIAFWLLAHGLTGAPIADAPRFIGAFAAAWLIGIVAIYAPGGLGVREVILVALLRSKVGAADALVIAAISRCTLTVIDLVAAGVGTIARNDRGRGHTGARSRMGRKRNVIASEDG